MHDIGVIDLKEAIDALKECLFKQDIGQYMECVNKIVLNIGRTMDNLPEDRIGRCNSILEYALGALNRKDYLNAADILKYELMPILYKEN